MSRDSASSSRNSASFIFTETPAEDELFHSLRTHDSAHGFIFRRRDGRVTGLMEVVVTMIRYAGTGPQWWFDAEIVEIRQNARTVAGPERACITGLWNTKKDASSPSRFDVSEFDLKENGK